MAEVDARWLVFHRWTRQHIIAADGLVFGAHGILAGGDARGHDRERAARRDPVRADRRSRPRSAELAGLRADAGRRGCATCNTELQRLAASTASAGRKCSGAVPLDPVLQWREQLITDSDMLDRQIANRATVDAIERSPSGSRTTSAWGRCDRPRPCSTRRPRSPATQSVPLSHLSIELGHLYMEDFAAGPGAAARAVRAGRAVGGDRAASLAGAVRGRPARISTCFLIDDYFAGSARRRGASRR